MVLAYHLIWTVYGWWLPNDPRGSSSREIRVERIRHLGDLHPGRKPVQPTPGELRDFHDEARDLLAHDVLLLSDEEIGIVASAFGKVISEEKYPCLACAIMPEHVHLVIARHRDRAEIMIEKFQDASKEELKKQKRRGVLHPVWGGPGWKVFLNTAGQMADAVEYVEENPEKSGRPRQNWRFVQRLPI